MKKVIATAVTPTAAIPTSTTWAVRRLDMAVKVMRDIDYDTIQMDGWAYYGPATVCGVWNPDGADRLMRFAQHVIFATMETIGLPLEGWQEFDAFVASWKEVTD